MLTPSKSYDLHSNEKGGGEPKKNGGGDICLNLISSVVQFSHPLFFLFSCISRYVTFVKLMHLNDLSDNV